jgi:hypothetical protein
VNLLGLLAQVVGIGPLGRVVRQRVSGNATEIFERGHMRTKSDAQGDWIKRLKARFPGLFCGISRWGFRCEVGWDGLITRLCERLDALALPGLRVVQVKEKFGTLRFYVEGGNKAVAGLIRQAEVESAETCEWCGSRGELRKSARGYFLTLCDSCFGRWASNGWIMDPPSHKQ